MLKIAAEKPRLRKASGRDGGCELNRERKAGGRFIQRVVCRSVTMATFAEELQRVGGEALSPPNVANMTGLTGSLTLN